MSSMRFYIQLDDATVEYKVDLAFLVQESDMPMPSHSPYMTNNNDFEMDVESSVGAGWNSVSGVEYKLVNQIGDSPSGYRHLKVLPAAAGIKYDITNQVTNIR